MDTYSSTIVREFRGGFQMTVNVYVPDTIIALFTMLDIELDDFVTTIFATIVGGDRVATPNLLAMARNLFLSLEYCRTDYESINKPRGVSPRRGHFLPSA